MKWRPIGDVVGLGKTLMASAVIRILEEDAAENAHYIAKKSGQGCGRIIDR
jgi:hypothetical protein